MLQLASGDEWGVIIIWNVSEGTIRKEFQAIKDYPEGHSAAVHSLAWSQDSKRLFSCSEDRTIKMWDLKGHVQKTLVGHGAAVLSIDVDPSSKRLVSGGRDGKIMVWNTTLGHRSLTISQHAGYVGS